MSKRNSWICEKETPLISSPVMDIIERDCLSSETGKKHKFYLLKSRDWCNVIPITADGNVVMVKQYRIGISEHTLELPGGVSDPTDEDGKATALREMEEETGYSPLPHSRWISLNSTHPNPAILDNQAHFYAVGPVQKTREQNLDPGEMIEVVEVPLHEIPEKIISGEISHSLMLNAFFFLALKSQGTTASLIETLSQFKGPATRGPEESI